jgi:hypothetical protein
VKRIDKTRTYVCSRCGKKYHPRKYAVSKSGRRYCSNSCLHNGRTKPKPCEWCGKLFRALNPRAAGLFCSRTCAGEAKTKVSRFAFCRECGQPFVTLPPPNSRGKNCTPKGQYCSVRCSGAFNGRVYCGDKNHRWKGGASLTYAGRRAYLIDYKLVWRAVRAGRLVLPEGWKLEDEAVQEWLKQRREFLCLKKQVEALTKYLRTGDPEVLTSLPPGYEPGATSPGT